MDDDGRQDDVSDTVLLVVPEKEEFQENVGKIKMKLTLSQVSLGQWQGFHRW